MLLAFVAAATAGCLGTSSSGAARSNSTQQTPLRAGFDLCRDVPASYVGHAYAGTATIAADQTLTATRCVWDVVGSPLSHGQVIVYSGPPMTRAQFEQAYRSFGVTVDGLAESGRFDPATSTLVSLRPDGVIGVQSVFSAAPPVPLRAATLALMTALLGKPPWVVSLGPHGPQRSAH